MWVAGALSQIESRREVLRSEGFAEEGYIEEKRGLCLFWLPCLSI